MFYRGILFLTIFITAFICRDFSYAQETTDKKDKINHSITLAQIWLNNFQLENGLYHYIFQPWGYIPADNDPMFNKKVNNPAPGEVIEQADKNLVLPYPNDDNIVRQILSYWALIKSTDFNKSEAVFKNIEAFERGLNKHIVIEDSPYGPALFIKYREGMKVNSTALYLAALISKTDRGFNLTEDQKQHIEYAVNGLKVFAAPTAGFYYYHNTDRLNFISSYGSGEAQLALAQYANMKGDAQLHKDIMKRFDEYYQTYFMNSLDNPEAYIDKERVGYHTWALYFLNEVDKFAPVDYQKYVKPLVQYAFDFKNYNTNCRNNPCIYSMQMWDSSSVEGLAAAYPLILKYETDQAFIQKVKDYLDASTDHLLSLQIHSVEEYEAKTGKVFKNNPDHLIGGFCDWPTCSYLRNEVTMHVVAALMAYSNLFYR